MTTQVKQVGSANSFEGRQRFSANDLVKAGKIALLDYNGNSKQAKVELDEFVKDKKGDYIRGIVVSVLTLATAIVAGKPILNKMLTSKGVVGKATRGISNFALKSADTVADWISSLRGKEFKEGTGIVTDFMKKEIKLGDKSKEFVNKILDKSAKRYKSDIINAAKNTAAWASEKTGVKTYKDIAKVGVAAGIGMVADEPIKVILDMADEGIDENQKISSDMEEKHRTKVTIPNRK